MKLCARGILCLFFVVQLALGMFGLGVVSGCHPKLMTTVAPGENDINVSAIAVYPFKAQYRFKPETSYARTVDLVNAALESRRFAVYSFGDFQMFSTDTMAAYEGQSLLSTIRAERVDPNALAILKGEVLFMEDNTVAGEQQPRQDGHRARERFEAKAWVELYHYGLRMPIARAETTFKIDPLEVELADPYPELTRQVRRIALAVMDLAINRVKSPPVHRTLPISFYSEQSTLFKLATEGDASLARQMLAMDEIERSVALLRGYQAFYPSITLAQVQKLTATPGILITRVHEPWASSGILKEGDIVTAVGGKRVRNAHQLDREATATKSGHPLSMIVTRDGEEISIEPVIP